MDADGNDNSPEWGYCTSEGCDQAALPLWLSGEWPDDPDLFLCPEHIGKRIAGLEFDLRLIRQYCGEYVAGWSMERRYKALIVSIPVIVDHALGDGISGTEEGYAIAVREGAR